MDETERLAEVYLQSLGFTDIRYEPDGNIPPDFLVDNRIAVEVRRLNQSHSIHQGPRQGLEIQAIPLWKSFCKYLLSLGHSPASGQSWYVYYRFSRPVPRWKHLERQLDQVLKPFMASDNPQPFEVTITENFSIKVFRAPTPKPTFFRPAGHSDEQSGGFLIEGIASNLVHCVDEKANKVGRYLEKYPEWWLVLSDQIGYGLDDFERELFLDRVNIQRGPFSRIVLLDPRDATRAFTL